MIQAKREVYELINGRRAKTEYNGDKASHSVFDSSIFWDVMDEGWFDIVHKKFGVMSRIIPKNVERVDFLTYSYPGESP